jgi:flagellum-specific peptidoglycan hydrolase FlgJ
MADNIFSPEQQYQLTELFSAFSGLAKETDPLIKAKIEETRRADEASKALKALGKQLGNSAIDYGKAVTSAGEGFGKFGGAITGATGAIGDWTSKLGMAGFVLGGFIKIFGEVAAKSLRQNDDLMKSYQNLSDMGSVAAGGLDALQEELGKVGLMAEEAEKFERVLKPITGELAKFGGSVTQGRDKLVGVIDGLIGPNNEMEKYLGRLGYSTQDIREGAADFVQRQSRLGLAQGKTQEQLTKESFRYLVTLKELQELTGMSRDEAQKAMDAQMADARFSLYLTKLKGDEGKNLSLYLSQYEDRFGKEAAAGLKDRILNEGRITTELAAGSFQSAANAYDEAMNAQKGGTKVFASSLENTATQVRKTLERLEPAFMITENGLRDMGFNNDLVNGALGTVAGTANKANKQLNSLGETGKNGSDRLNQNIDNEQRTRAMRIAADKAVYEVGNLTVGLFTKLNEAMFGFGKTLAKVADWMSTIVPGMKKTNYSDAFRDITDNTKDLSAATKEKSQLLSQIESVKKEIEEAEKGKADYAKQIRDKQAEISEINKLYRTEKDIDKKKELFAKETEEKRNLLRLEQYARQSGKSKDGGVDSKIALDLRKSKLAELTEQVRKEEEKILILKKEQEKLEPSKTVPAKQDTTEIKPIKADVNQKEFYNKMYNTLLEQAKKSGVDNPEVVAKLGATQSSLETGFGKSLAGGKNYFGIKDTSKTGSNVQTTKEVVNGKEVEVRDKFRTYGSMEESAQDFINFLIKNPRYKEVLAATSIDDAIQAQGKTGYATDPRYAAKLKSIYSGASGEVPEAKFGKKFNGPSTGFPVIAHGNESVWPDDTLMQTLNQVQQSSLTKYKNELMDTLGLSMKSANSSSISNAKLIEMMQGAVNQQSLNKGPSISTPTAGPNNQQQDFDKLASIISTNGNYASNQQKEFEKLADVFTKSNSNEKLLEALKQSQQSSLSQYKNDLMDTLGLKSKNLEIANAKIVQNMPDTKGIIDSLKQEIPKLTETTTTQPSNVDNFVKEVMTMLSEKMDSLIAENRKGNDIQDQILTYTRA